MPKHTSTQLDQFRKTIWAHYASHRRSFPWRENLDSLTEKDRLYRIIISEIMLQQTQAPRVVPKYESFLKKFPDFETLAKASLPEVLSEWQGLGYNRRGMYLKRIAEAVSVKKEADQETLPSTYERLVLLPGIGPNTAGSILAFAFNTPHPFIETNIRSVYIHFFFPRTKEKINDSKILELVEKTIDKENPREWFFALMDYGVFLKATAKIDPARKSSTYKKQTTFKGSNRELRAKILKEILRSKSAQRTTIKIAKIFIKKNPHYSSDTVMKNIQAMKKEGLLED